MHRRLRDRRLVDGEQGGIEPSGARQKWQRQAGRRTPDPAGLLRGAAPRAAPHRAAPPGAAAAAPPPPGAPTRSAPARWRARGRCSACAAAHGPAGRWARPGTPAGGQAGGWVGGQQGWAPQQEGGDELAGGWQGGGAAQHCCQWRSRRCRSHLPALPSHPPSRRALTARPPCTAPAPTGSRGSCAARSARRSSRLRGAGGGGGGGRAGSGRGQQR